MLEATLVHLRLLDDFLGERRKHPRDIHASDWIAGWAGAAWLPGDVRRRVSGQVAHLSKDRDPWVDWDIRAYAHACCRALDRFLEQVRQHNAPRYPALAKLHRRARDGMKTLAPQT